MWRPLTTLIVPILGTVLPHPAIVLDMIIGAMDTVVVNLSNTDQKCLPSRRHVVRNCNAGLGCYGRRRTAIVSSTHFGLIERLHDVAERLDTGFETIVLVEAQWQQQIVGYSWV